MYWYSLFHHLPSRRWFQRCKPTVTETVDSFKLSVYWKAVCTHWDVTSNLQNHIHVHCTCTFRAQRLLYVHDMHVQSCIVYTCTCTLIHFEPPLPLASQRNSRVEWCAELSEWHRHPQQHTAGWCQRLGYCVEQCVSRWFIQFVHELLCSQISGRGWVWQGHGRHSIWSQHSPRRTGRWGSSSEAITSDVCILMIVTTESSDSSGVFSTLTDANDTLFDTRRRVVGDIREVHTCTCKYTDVHVMHTPSPCVYNIYVHV